jgi:arylsulfatase A-like enzyme
MKPSSLAVLFVAALLSCSDESRRPNVLLITIDTLRADHLTPYGSERDTTPFLAEFAAESVLFSDVVSQCGTTPQSLSSLMTGAYPYTDLILTKNGVFDYLTREQRTLAASLTEQGYRTHAITASIQSSEATGLELGFETFDGVDIRSRNKAFMRRTANEVSELALRWLESEAPQDAPFFLWLHYLDPHHPYEAPDSYAHYFRWEEPTVEGATHRYRFDELLSMDHPLTEGDISRMILAYDRELRFTDDALRRLFDRAPLLSQNTLSIVTADHGEALGSHGMISHNDLYDTILRVPLMIRLPWGRVGGRRSSTPAMLTDIVPTVHDVLGIPSSAPVRGTSLRPWMESGRAPTAPPRLRRSEYAHQSATFDGHLKLIERAAGTELYDRSKDPGELDNLVTRRMKRAKYMLAASRTLARNPLGTAPAQSPAADAQANPAAPEVSQEMLDELKALGYLGDQ